MLKNTYRVLFILVCIILIFGCNTAIKVGDLVVGMQSGKFFYTDEITIMHHLTGYGKHIKRL